MREQVVTSRAGRSAPGRGGRAGAVTQRPARRGRAGSGGRSAQNSSVWSKVLQLAPLFGKLLLAVSVGLLVFAGYRVAASAAFFQARAIDITGTERTSSDDVKTLVRRAVALTGVWKADLGAISDELVNRLPWVRTAVVSRVLPSGIRVRITERVPRAVVRTAAGRFVWVDTDGVMLGAAAPSDQMPPFFIRGWDESDADRLAGNAENRLRIMKYLEMEREWKQLGLAGRVSEVDLNDLRDVRAQLAGDDSHIEVRLGREDFGERLRLALEKLDEQRRTSNGALVTYIDATLATQNHPAQNHHVIIGLNPKAPANAADGSVAQTETAKSSHRDTPRPGGAPRKEVKNEAARHSSGEKRDVAVDDVKTKTRPRRVG